MTLPEELVRLSLIDLDDDEPVNRDATMFSAALVDRVWHHAVESAWYAYLKIGGVHTGDRLLEALSVRDRALRVRRLSMLDESEVFPLRWGDLTRDLLELCVGAVSLRVGNNFMLVPPESTLCQLTSLRIDEVLPCDTMLGYFAALPRLSDCSIGAYRMAMSDTQDDSPMRLVSLSVKLADYEDMVRAQSGASADRRSKTRRHRSSANSLRARRRHFAGSPSTVPRSAASTPASARRVPTTKRHCPRSSGSRSACLPRPKSRLRRR